MKNPSSEEPPHEEVFDSQTGWFDSNRCWRNKWAMRGSDPSRLRFGAGRSGCGQNTGGELAGSYSKYPDAMRDREVQPTRA